MCKIRILSFLTSKVPSSCNILWLPDYRIDQTVISDSKITHPKTILINLRGISSNLIKIWPEKLDLFFLPEPEQSVTYS